MIGSTKRLFKTLRGNCGMFLPPFIGFIQSNSAGISEDFPRVFLVSVSVNRRLFCVSGCP